MLCAALALGVTRAGAGPPTSIEGVEGVLEARGDAGKKDSGGSGGHSDAGHEADGDHGHNCRRPA